MIYITGDCHGNFERFNASIFPEQNEMTKDEYVIIWRRYDRRWNIRNGFSGIIMGSGM